MDERDFDLKFQKEINKERIILHKRKMRVLLARIGLLAMLLIVSTYAWFTSQKDITLSNIRGTVEVVENMEISLDAKTWHQRIDLGDAINTFAEAQLSRDQALNETDTKSTALAIVPEQLFPVSGVGVTGVPNLPLYAGEATSTSLSGITVCDEEEVIDGKDIAKDNGYIAFDMYIKNTSRDSEVDILQLNINSSAQVLTETINKEITDVTGNRVARDYYGNEDSGLQNTIRVALAKYANDVSSTSTQLEILNATKGANIADVAIWEPNAYDHVETIVSNNNKLINGTNENPIPFAAYDSTKTLVDLETYALTATAENQIIENVYNIASTGLGAQNTFKTDNIKDRNEILSYRIKTKDNKPINIKNTSNNDFEIAANTVTRYRVYIWLEGQDVDCINVASLGGGIELDLGLTKDDETGDVISEIDERLVLSATELTTEPVTATITMEEVITVLPEGWAYTDGTKLAIKKEYDGNIIEQVEMQTEDGKYTKIEVTIDNIDTFAKQVSENREVTYGLYTDYPVDVDGDATNNDWKIFYGDERNVFLILDDYALIEKVGSDKLVAAGLTALDVRRVLWENPRALNYTISDSKYMISKANMFTSSNRNYKAVGSLLATENWTNFVNTTYADDAIGAPTIEMWCESWNTLHNETDYPNEQIYCNNADASGYYIETSPDVVNPVNGYLNMGSYVGYTETTYKSELYFPHKSGVDSCQGYYIASPSMEGEESLLMIYRGGRINNYRCNDEENNFRWALRPVVALKTGVLGTKVDDVWQLTTN